MITTCFSAPRADPVESRAAAPGPHPTAPGQRCQWFWVAPQVGGGVSGASAPQGLPDAGHVNPPLPEKHAEALIVSLGGEIHGGAGSRVAFELKGRRAYLHRPHPGREAKRYQVEEVREFLRSLEIQP